MIYHSAHSDDNFLVPDFAWKTKEKTKTRPNTKFLPICNGRNNKQYFEVSMLELLAFEQNLFSNQINPQNQLEISQRCMFELIASKKILQIA